MDRNEQAVKMFCIVRDTIDRTRYPSAYRMAFKKPFRFYLEHSTEEAIAILISENETV